MNTNSSPPQPQRRGGTATAEQGQVMLDGPDGVAIAMTPEAAETTAASLSAAAKAARRQSDD
ncbi:hypothetical protein [Sphingosinithalassobacter sp. LHW66-3]|uniref:hypothetical protein n=1 Tax=Sphingosinithalassobacter sp. LHW66-3 TaxID=3424718 RepID=UPI003D6A508B